MDVEVEHIANEVERHMNWQAKAAQKATTTATKNYHAGMADALNWVSNMLNPTVERWPVEHVNRLSNGDDAA